MKTQCPNCKTFLDVPLEYENRQVKCLTCKQLYPAVNYSPPLPEPVPIPPPDPSDITCPNCGSTQIMGDKKGFSGGKAVGGALLLGPLGLLIGLHGSKKVVVSCLKCGHRWQPDLKP